MRKIYIPIDECTKHLKIPIGKTGEHNAVSIVFDFSEWIKKYPPGDVSIFIETPNHEQYERKLPNDGNNYIWTITEHDTVKSGMIRCQLIYDFGTGNVRSEIFKGMIAKDISEI